MKKILLLFTLVLFSIQLNSQNLDKIRLLCIDEVDLSEYSGELSEEDLKSQISALGFRYIDNGQIKYHKELIVYNCNTAKVNFTAFFDQNKLVKKFIQYESDEIVKKIIFSKKNENTFVDLSLNYKGQEIPATPVGVAEIYENGKLSKTINFSDNNNLPFIVNYNTSRQKISEGTATISGYLRENWKIKKVGEWKYFDSGKLASISTYDSDGNENLQRTYNNEVLLEERKFSSNGVEEISTFYTNGKIKESGNQKGTTKLGTWKYYDNTGALKKQVDYVEGDESLVLLFDENKSIKKQSERVRDKSEIPQLIRSLPNLYFTQTFYSNNKLKTEGYESKGKKVGVFEIYGEEGDLTEIIEYDFSGKKINNLDANTYQKIRTIEKQVFRELLVIKTTHPDNIKLLRNIKLLASSLNLDLDSIMGGYQYKDEFIEKSSVLLDKTNSFGNLSKSLDWYDSLLTSSEHFNNEVWAFSHDLYDIELSLEKKLALNKIDTRLSSFKEEHTSIKKSFFGEKLIVLNEQKDIYELVVDKIYPEISSEISVSRDKYKVNATVEEFNFLIEKASSIIAKPDQKLKKALKSSKSIQDKRQILLSVK